MIIINSFSGFNTGGGGAPGKTAKVNFTDIAYPASSPGWNNYNHSSLATPLNLLDTDGVSTGWSISASIAESDIYTVGTNTPATTDFPLDIVNTAWYSWDFAIMFLVIHGLNPADTYDLIIGLPVDPGADYVVNNLDVGHESIVTEHDLGLILATVEDKYTGLKPNPDGTLTIDISTIDECISTLAGLILKVN